jgi:PKD repeat protein
MKKEKMKQKNKTVLFSVLAVFMLIAVTATVSAAENVVWFEPENSNATHCDTTDVDILLNATAGVMGFDIWIKYDPDCANITNAAPGNFPMMFLVKYEEGATHMVGATFDWNDVAGNRLKIATITIHCENKGGDQTTLDLDDRCELGNAAGGRLGATWHDGTFTCEASLNPPPLSDPSGPYTSTEGVQILFNGSGSYDPDGSIVAYEWDLGDGNNATGVSPTHTYTQNGTYTITLNVTDDDGATDANTTTATIADTKPTANFSSTPTTGPEPLTVDFTDNSTSFDGITAWEWDFGDGDNSSEQNPTHVYANEGLYTVTLTVYEADGNSDTEAKVNYITVTDGNGGNQPPVADANGTYTGVEGVPTTYNGSSSYDPDGSIVLYEWDFDGDDLYDAATSTATFTWGDDHTGTVKLRVTDNDGLSDTDTATITVNNVAPTASFYVEQPEEFILPSHSLTFNGAFIDAGWLDTHTATWDFGDDTIVSGTFTEENDPPDAAGTTTAEHAYSEPGTYTVTLTVTDDDEGVGDYEEEVTVISAEEAAGIIIDQLGSSTVPDEAPKGVAQKIESAIDKLEHVIEFLDHGKYCDAIGKLDGMITQIEGAIDQVNEQRCIVKECKGKKCTCIVDEDANELIECLEQAKEGARAIRDLISKEHPECA